MPGLTRHPEEKAKAKALDSRPRLKRRGQAFRGMTIGACARVRRTGTRNDDSRPQRHVGPRPGIPLTVMPDSDPASRKKGKSKRPWIPAFAGMTIGRVCMTDGTRVGNDDSRPTTSCRVPDDAERGPLLIPGRSVLYTPLLPGRLSRHGMIVPERSLSRRGIMIAP